MCKQWSQSLVKFYLHFIIQRYYLSFKIKINVFFCFLTKKIDNQLWIIFPSTHLNFHKFLLNFIHIYIRGTFKKCLIILSNPASKYISPHCGLQKRTLAERSKQSPPWQSHNSWGQSDCIFKSPTVSYIYTWTCPYPWSIKYSGPGVNDNKLYL